MVGHDSGKVTKVSCIIPLLLRNCRQTRDQELHPSPTVLPEENTGCKKDEIRRDIYFVEAAREIRKPASNLLSIAHARNSGNSVESDIICNYELHKPIFRYKTIRTLSINYKNVNLENKQILNNLYNSNKIIIIIELIRVK